MSFVTFHAYNAAVVTVTKLCQIPGQYALGTTGATRARGGVKLICATTTVRATVGVALAGWQLAAV